MNPCTPRFALPNQGALLVFDVTDVKSFEAVKKWKNDIDAKVCRTN